MLERVISGGQTGADRAGWRAARACGIPTGGFMAKWSRTEGEIGPDGVQGPEEGHPEFAERFEVEELPTPGYLERTRRNAREAEATIWFGDLGSPGSWATHKACSALGRPILDVIEGEITPPVVAAWIVAEGIKVLNVAGNRESTSPGIGESVERFLLAVFRQLAEG